MKASKCDLPDKSVRWLQDLIQINIDSRDGFREAVANLEDRHASLKSLFNQIATERDSQARELQTLVMCNDEKATESGSVSAAAHRMWMDLRTALGGGDKAVLEEAERGEDVIKEKYESALNDLSGCACCDTLRKHYSAVTATHNKVRDLRDNWAEARSSSTVR